METYQYSNFALISQHLIISICALLLPLAASAQTQQGHVRTLGRPDAKGVALSGVAVRVKGEHNAVLSGADGSFAIALPGKKNGEAYVLQQVRKAGYELNENGVIGRQFAFSDKVPLTLVMVSTSQLQADKQRIENTAYQVAERNYKTKMEALERQREAGSLAAEQYRAEIQDLQDKFEKYQSLIDDLAEHYAHTDYDLLDEHDREINLCIEQGDLDRADSLIHALFNPVDALRRNKEALAHIDQSESQARQLLAQANSDMAAVLKQQERDAEYLYQLYTIALARYDNEKAAQYIETRAELDTMNVDWQNDAGRYINDFIGDYSRTLYYYQRVLRHSLIQFGEENEWVARGYNNCGFVYNQLGDYTTALDYHFKALSIREKVFGPEHYSVAGSFNNIGSVYANQGDNHRALEFYQKALTIHMKVYGEEHLNVAASYNNIGFAYDKQGDYPKALEYYQDALTIVEKILGPEHVKVATSYNNVGMIYSQMGDYTKALEYLQKAQTTLEKVLGDGHPTLATLYNNIGLTYQRQGDYSKALEFHQKALAIRENAVGNEHPEIAICYNNIGEVYFKQGDYAKALELHIKAIEIEERSLGPEHPSLATSYRNVAGTYRKLKDYPKALEYLLKALEINKKSDEPDHLTVASTYTNIGIVYEHLNDYPKALECFQKALVIFEKQYGPEHYDIAMTHTYIAADNYKLGNYPESLASLQKALIIFEKTVGTDNPKTQSVKKMIERVNSKMNE